MWGCQLGECGFGDGIVMCGFFLDVGFGIGFH